MAAPQRIRELFDQAITLTPEDRSALFQRFQHEPEVVSEVRQLLQAMDSDTGLLNRSPLPPAKNLNPGDRLGPYRIDQLLGRGGMGAVYRATRIDDTFEKIVAIKIVSTGVGLEAFRRERQILATLEHPNIARLLDGGATQEGTPYLVMEFVSGRTLTDQAAIAAMSVRDRFRQFLEVCEGVEYLHRNLIVHRDLKPANILVTGDGTPKLLDFGISKILQEDASPIDATRTVGLTPRYASPEQILQKPVTTASDIYSLGVILYELLTNGRYPYATTGSEAHVYLEAALHGLAKPPGLNPDLDAITLKAIARDPVDRYRSVAELREDLERYLGSLPVRARAGGWSYAARKFVVRNKSLVAAIGFAALAIGFGVWGVLRDARIASEQKVAAERSSNALRASTAEQTRLRDEAEKQRKRAEDQLVRARSLISTMLFEVHDSMQFLQGSAAVKSKIIRTSLKQLEELAKEAEGTPAAAEMQSMLSRTYERAGNLASGSPGEKSADLKQAIAYFQKALEIDHGLPSTITMSPFAIATIHTKIGSAMQRIGQNEDAWRHMRQAIQIVETTSVAARTSAEGRRTEAIATANACHIAGSQQKVETEPICLRAARLMDDLGAGEEDPRVAETRGSNYTMLATKAAKRNDISAALVLIRAASSFMSSCLKQSPRDAHCMQGLAVTGTYTSLWLEQLNDPNAEQVHRDALGVFETIERHSPNLSALHYARASVERGLALLLWRSGRKSSEARDLYKASLQRLLNLFNKFEVAAFSKNDYADELLESPWPEFRNDGEALRLAEQAALGTMRQPGALDTLAKAQLAMGHPAEALATAEEALSRAKNLKLPKLEREIERTLTRVRGGSAPIVH